MTALERLVVRNNNAEALRLEWLTLMPSAEMPRPRQFILWVEIHSVEAMLRAIRQTARKFDVLNGEMSLDFLVRYASKAANSIEAPHIDSVLTRVM